VENVIEIFLSYTTHYTNYIIIHINIIFKKTSKLINYHDRVLNIDIITNQV